MLLFILFALFNPTEDPCLAAIMLDTKDADVACMNWIIKDDDLAKIEEKQNENLRRKRNREERNRTPKAHRPSVLPQHPKSR